MPVIQGPRCNRRVSCSSNPSNDRSESAVIIDPQNPYHMVAASKKFTDPLTYDFSLACYYSFDGGQSWGESPTLSLIPTVLITSGPGKNDDWSGVSDPALAFDNLGNVFLFGLPFKNLPMNAFELRGMAVYKSMDGGRTWSAPNHIHNVIGDDKQWCAGDVNPASPFYGRVYGCWDAVGSTGPSGGSMCFARTTDNGATWKSVKISNVDQPAGTPIPGITNSFAPEINVMPNGDVFIVYTDAGSNVYFIKSTDGGDSFGQVKTVASGITNVPGQLPGGKFRTLTLATACAGTGNNIVVAWADYRDGVAHIYYSRSGNGGNSFSGSSGSRLLTGANASAADQHEFHPQLISTPNGEIGCTFYLFGPKSPAPNSPPLIDVILAVSTNNASSFTEKTTVTDQAWDPTVDEVWAHGDSTVTFIGDYFGFDASRLGFFPLWTDTRTSVQEIFCSRLSVNPADVYIRDSSTDVGNVPSPGYHWEYVDLIVRRQPDGNTTWVNEDLLHDGMTTHYIYAKVTNNGPNKALNVMLAAKVANWPPLNALPGTEFRYPQDWYKDDWNGAPLHTDLGTSVGVDINFPSATQIIGPVIWPPALIPDPNTWVHPCLLVEVLADNNDSAGGPSSIPVPAEGDKNACNYGSYFWGSNNITQRNLSYAPVVFRAMNAYHFSFIAGNQWSPSRYMEIIIDKGKELADLPMWLSGKQIRNENAEGKPGKHGCGELVLTEKTTVIVRSKNADIGKLVVAPGTVWKCSCDDDDKKESKLFGAEKKDKDWDLLRPKSSVGFAIEQGAKYEMTLSFAIPPNAKIKKETSIRIYQRNDKRILTGGVIIKFKPQELKKDPDEDEPTGKKEKEEKGKKKSRKKMTKGTGNRK
jgi:hypothetical protein